MTAYRAIDERVVSVILTQIKSVFATSGASKFDTHTTPRLGHSMRGLCLSQTPELLPAVKKSGEGQAGEASNGLAGLKTGYLNQIAEVHRVEDFASAVGDLNAIIQVELTL